MVSRDISGGISGKWDWCDEKRINGMNKEFVVGKNGFGVVKIANGMEKGFVKVKCGEIGLIQ